MQKVKMLFPENLPEGMIAGMTGTRKGATEEQLSKFTKLLKKYEVVELHHGDAIGADEQCHKIAAKLGLRTMVHPPILDRYRAFCKLATKVFKKKEYLVRNRDIVNSSKIMFGFPSGTKEELRSGTWACIRYALKIKHRLIIIFPDGSTKSYNK